MTALISSIFPSFQVFELLTVTIVTMEGKGAVDDKQLSRWLRSGPSRRGKADVSNHTEKSQLANH